MIYPSKRDWLLGLIIWGGVAFGIGISSASASIFSIITMVVLTIFVIWIWFGTYYILGHTNLLIKSGPFTKILSLDQIISIKRTKNPLASFALSLNRLEIKCQKGGSILISPKDDVGFLKMLQEQNPGIKIEQLDFSQKR